MGADNLISFHRWHKSELITQKCNIIVFDRHGYKKKSLNSITFKRLNKKKDINWVAEYIVNAGYDIASYNSEEDTFLNRFIEVKSFEGEKPYFFWSKNEFRESKIRKNQYWLYLVNRNKINDNDYYPTMINNPFENILQNDDWKKSIENYKIQQI